jgi:hypothetical protein
VLSLGTVESAWVSAIDAPDPRTFNSNGVSISYTVEGKGEPVVLIHGLFVNADLNWQLLLWKKSGPIGRLRSSTAPAT